MLGNKYVATLCLPCQAQVARTDDMNFIFTSTDGFRVNHTHFQCESSLVEVSQAIISLVV